MVTLEQIKTLINGLMSNWLSPMRSNVSRAQTTSDQARVIADKAQSTADTAKTAADTAKATADTAKATADANEQNLLTIGTTPIQLPKGYYRSAAYGNGKYVVLGDSIGVYSEDGINWIPIPDLPFDISIHPWRSVAYGNGRFVSVSYEYWACSEDGIHWNTGKITSAYSVEGVTYGDGKFVAVGTNCFFYSEDGINWTPSHHPTPDGTVTWYVVTYGNGRFLTVNSLITRAAYSEDGINWTEVSLPYSSNLHTSRPIVYGSGKFVFIDGINCYYTENGIVWYMASLPRAGGKGLAYGDNHFLAEAAYSDSLLVSNDGVSWREMSPPNGPDAANILEFLNGKFTAIGTQGAVAYATPDIYNWTKTRSTITQTTQRKDTEIKQILHSGSVVQVLSLDGSSKRFVLVVDDSGTTTATEI